MSLRMRPVTSLGMSMELVLNIHTSATTRYVNQAHHDGQGMLGLFESHGSPVCAEPLLGRPHQLRLTKTTKGTNLRILLPDFTLASHRFRFLLCLLTGCITGCAPMRRVPMKESRGLPIHNSLVGGWIRSTLL